MNLRNSSIHIRSNGKLLLTGEYLVLLGAKALALPVKLGQELRIEHLDDVKLIWKSMVKGVQWFEAEFSLPEFHIRSTNQPQIADTLQQILRAANGLNEFFPSLKKGYEVISNIDFNLNWGLGSSSSLVSNIAWWANCDPYLLNYQVFKGSGYDIAAARSNAPLVFQLNKKMPLVRKVHFRPVFSENLYFVWLNQKQNTREGLVSFDRTQDYSAEIQQLNSITERMIEPIDFNEFCQLLTTHEQIISSVLNTETVQQLLFPDFFGVVKSLGAWGGDFVLAASNQPKEEVFNYFAEKGFSTIFNYAELVL